MSASETVKYAAASTGPASRCSGSSPSSTGTFERWATSRSAGARPRSVSTAGWIPRARSRSSEIAARSSSSAPATSSPASSPFSIRRRAIPSDIDMATSRCCAPSCRSRSSRRRSASAAAMMRARESWRALTRAAITGSGLALSSARATPPCSATRPRTASRKSSQTGSASGVTSSPFQTLSTCSRPMSAPSGSDQPQAAIVSSPAAVPARQTTTVNETSPIGSSSSR